MLSGAYAPRWVNLLDENGRSFGCAIAFTSDRRSSQYAGNLTHDQIVDRLAIAEGALGSAADYLFQTCESLRSNGIPDGTLELLEASVLARKQLIAPARDPFGK
jgi:cation transport protein ChaC